MPADLGFSRKVSKEAALGIAEYDYVKESQLYILIAILFLKKWTNEQKNRKKKRTKSRNNCWKNGHAVL